MKKIVEIKAGDPIPKNGIYRGSFEKEIITGYETETYWNDDEEIPVYETVRYYFYEVPTKVKKR